MGLAFIINIKSPCQLFGNWQVGEKSPPTLLVPTNAILTDSSMSIPCVKFSVGSLLSPSDFQRSTLPSLEQSRLFHIVLGSRSPLKLDTGLSFYVLYFSRIRITIKKCRLYIRHSKTTIKVNNKID